MEEEEVKVVVVLGEKVAQDAVRVATFDLVGRQAEVDTLYEVPELSNGVIVEPPVEQKRHDEKKTSMKISKIRLIFAFFVCVFHFFLFSLDDF